MQPLKVAGTGLPLVEVWGLELAQTVPVEWEYPTLIYRWRAERSNTFLIGFPTAQAYDILAILVERRGNQLTSLQVNVGAIQSGPLGSMAWLDLSLLKF